MEGNAEKWLHMHKQKHGLGTWGQFMAAIQQKIGVYEYRHAVDDILKVKPIGIVQEYFFDNCKYFIY
jgi:hypothetical protein